jgi:hypothetical protein
MNARSILLASLAGVGLMTQASTSLAADSGVVAINVLALPDAPMRNRARQLTESRDHFQD